MLARQETPQARPYCSVPKYMPRMGHRRREVAGRGNCLQQGKRAAVKGAPEGRSRAAAWADRIAFSACDKSPASVLISRDTT